MIKYEKQTLKFLRVTQECDNIQEAYLILQIKFERSTITRTIISVIY